MWDLGSIQSGDTVGLLGAGIEWEGVVETVIQVLGDPTGMPITAIVVWESPVRLICGVSVFLLWRKNGELVEEL